jgi:hypothetical protein
MWDNSGNFNDRNVKQWNEFFGGRVSLTDLNTLLYKTRIGQVDTLIFRLKDGKTKVTGDLKSNAILDYPNKQAAIEFLYYLGFAKRCEPYALQRTGWYYGEKDEDAETKYKEEDEIQKLLDGGQKNMTRARNKFIRERYLFQLVRLRFYGGMNADCYTYFKQNRDSFTQPSMLYRSLGYVAGSLWSLQDYAKANYYYSLIYDKYPFMKTEAYFSFHPQNEDDWQQTLALATNDREKAVLWHLSGIYSNDAVPAMQHIYDIDPKSDLLDLLLVRAVNMEEERFINQDDMYYWGDGTKWDSTHALHAEKMDGKLVRFIQQVANAGNTAKPYLWNLAAGYLEIAKRSYDKGNKYLDIAAKQAEGDRLVQDQIRLIRLVQKIEAQGKPDARFENEIVGELRWLQDNNSNNSSLRADDAARWAYKRLGHMHLVAGDTIKAQCFDDLGYDDTYNGFYKSHEWTLRMLAFMRKKEKTPYEEFMLSIYPYKEADLLEVLAVQELYSFRFREAIALFDQGAKDFELFGDPFLIHIKDCHDCDHAAPQKRKYTRRDFAQAMLDLQEKTKSDPKNAAQHYFKIANGCYNMTYYGNARAASDTRIGFLDMSRYYWYDGLSAQYRRNSDDTLLDCGSAESFYLKARDASADKDFKAKCTFMAAKCEMNNGYPYDNPYGDGPWPEKVDFIAGRYFKELKSDYAKTKYYKDIIRECGYFATYVRK